MASSEKAKFNEGMEYVRQAEKSLKTSLFKWRPDFEGAAMDYANAATNFKNAKAYAQCKDALLKASDCYRQHHSLFSAAKCLEQAALVAKDMGELDETVRLIERACVLFQEHGTPDTAALALEKGAKMVESRLPEKASNMYLRAADVVLLEDRPRQAAEYLGKAARLLVKMRMYDDATSTVEREIEMQIKSENQPVVGRLVVALVLIHLTRGDLIAAQKAFNAGSSYVEEEECQVIVSLLEAYEEEDGELASRALNSPFLKHMDVEYARLARSLGIPSNANDSAGRSERQSSIVSTDSASSLSARTSDNSARFGLTQSSASNPQEQQAAGASGRDPPTRSGPEVDDDDEYAGGLC